MTIGSIRHASDIKTENVTPQSQGILTEQTGIILVHMPFYFAVVFRLKVLLSQFIQFLTI